jgi:nucleotide-binding universal stress UspA family protein
MKEPMTKILVACDGSPVSESVFASVMPLIRAYTPEVAVLYVFEHPDAAFMPPAEVAKACGALRSAGVNAYLELREGAPSEEILKAARQLNADVLAISTHGRSGVMRLFAGSVAEAVLRKSEIPVLVTRPGTVVHDWKKIVVALDGSRRGESILPEAVRLAKKMKAALEVLQVAVPVVAGTAGEAPVVLPPEDPMPYLKGVVRQLAGQGITAKAVALEGPVSSEILRYLKESGASLLCMSTHGWSGLARMVLGSVGEEVMRKAPCPVLLQRSAIEVAERKRPPRKSAKAR